VEELDLATNCINDIESPSTKGTEKLANALKDNFTLTKVDLSRNAIQLAEGAKSLAEAIEVNRTLRHLNLEHNSIGRKWVEDSDTIYLEEDDPTKYTDEFAKTGELFGNTPKGPGYVYTTEGFAEFCAALEVNEVHNRCMCFFTQICLLQGLVYLDLSDNYLFDEGARLLIESIPKSKTLRYIDLSGNFISDENCDLLHGVCEEKGIKLSLAKKEL
jgi:Leucine-rich repeat (LRR) protein